MFQKNAVLPELYHFDHPNQQSQIDNLHANDQARADLKVSNEAAEVESTPAATEFESITPTNGEPTISEKN